MSKVALYLGESKWDRSSEEIVGGALLLRPEQLSRHAVFRFYIEQFAFGPFSEWNEFLEANSPNFSDVAPGKPLAPPGSLLAANLEQVLLMIRSHFPSRPQIQDALLYLHGGVATHPLPDKAPGNFKLVVLDYSAVSHGNLVSFEL